MCGDHLSRYTCRATRVAADFLDFRAICRCSTGVALHPLKFWCRTSPPPAPGGVAPKFGSEKVSRYTGVSQLQLRVSRYTVQLRILTSVVVELLLGRSGELLEMSGELLGKPHLTTLSAAQCEIPPPPYRAIPFRDSIAEGGIAPHLPCFHRVSRKYR